MSDVLFCKVVEERPKWVFSRGISGTVISWRQPFRELPLSSTQPQSSTPWGRCPTASCIASTSKVPQSLVPMLWTPIRGRNETPELKLGLLCLGPDPWPRPLLQRSRERVWNCCRTTGLQLSRKNNLPISAWESLFVSKVTALMVTMECSVSASLPGTRDHIRTRPNSLMRSSFDVGGLFA